MVLRKMMRQFLALTLGTMLTFSSLSLDVYAMSENQQDNLEEVVLSEEAESQEELSENVGGEQVDENTFDDTLTDEETVDEDTTDEDAADEDTVYENLPDQDVADEEQPVEEKTEGTKKYFKVSYEALDDGVINLPVDDHLYSYGDTVYVVSEEPGRADYEFWGWSLTGDPSEVYTSGWSFKITEDVTFYATWDVEEETFLLGSSSNKKKENGIVTAINNYVNSLNGRFNPIFNNGHWTSKECCAFCDYIWHDVFGIVKGVGPKAFTVIKSDRKLKGSEIYEFLKANDAQPGDWIWCHDPFYREKDYSITHNMIIMDYDSESITITDGMRKNGVGVVWSNNERCSLFSGSHYNGWFCGNSYITLYKITDESIHERFNPKSPKPFITSVDDDVKYSSFTLDIKAHDGEDTAAGDVYVKVWPTRDGESSVPENWQSLGIYKAYHNTSENTYRFNYSAKDIKNITDFTYQIYLYDENGDLAEKYDAEHISLGVLNQASGKCGDNLTWTLKESASNLGYYDLTINGTGRMYDYGWYDDVNHTAPWDEQIRKFRSNGYNYYNSLRINPGITYIGKDAFSDISSLKSSKKFTIPDTVTEIGESAFSSFPYKGELVIPDSVKSMGQDAFRGSRISSVDIGKGISVIPVSCFEGCSNLSYVRMSNSVTTIESNAFNRAGTYQSFFVVFSENLKTIDDHAFSGCTTLRSEDLSFISGLDNLGEYAFSYCESLEGELVISGRFKEVPFCAFENCKSITKLILEEGIEEICYMAFKGCSGLTGNLVLPESLRTISGYSFKDCSGLTGTLIIPANVYNIYDGAFMGCSGFTGLNLIGGVGIAPRVFENCSNISGDVIVPYRIYGINNEWYRIFYGCDKVDRFVLAGGWRSGGFYKKIVGKGVRGTIEEGLDTYDDMVLSTFPENAKLYIDTSIYNNNEIPEMLTTLGYDIYTLEASYYPVTGVKAPDRTFIVTELGAGRTSSQFLDPFYASDKEIDIEIADSTIVSVDMEEYERGELANDYLWTFKPHKVGDTTYTVTSADGGYTATGKIRVVKDDTVVTSVYIDYSSKTIKKNEKTTLTATISPSKAKNKAVVWKSSNPKIATVDTKGVVTGKARGQCIITVTTKDGGLTDTCEITVDADTYTVTFDPNGGEGTMDDMYCDPGKKYTLPANTFTRPGYVFDHWNTEPEDYEYFYQSNIQYANKESFTDLAGECGNITLYASWRPEKSYTIVYDSNTKNSHGAVIYGTMDKDPGYAFNDEDGKVYVENGDYLAKGVSFVNWNTQADGKGISVEAYDEYTPHELGAKELTKNGIQNVVLYAQWEENSYDISFDLDGGRLTDTSFGDSQVTVYRGANNPKGLYTFGTAVKKMPVAAREGYTFGGWFYDATCKKAAKTLPANITADTTLYAKWTAYKYTLTLDANKNQGGAKHAVSGSAKKITAYYGQDLPELKNSFVNKGYKLVGWTNEKGDSTAVVSADDIITADKIETLLGSIANNDKKTLYAVWEKAPYSISYELNMPEKSAAELEEICSAYVKSYEYGDPSNTGIVLPAPERDGYTFGGWFTDSTLKKAKKAMTAKDFGNITLFAKWTAVYTVRLHDCDSESGNELAVKDYTGYKFETAKALPANPYSKVDAAFIGWATTNMGEVEYANKQKISAPVLTKTDSGFVLDLYAVWQKRFTVQIMTDLRSAFYAKGEKNLLPSTDGFSYTYSDVKKKAITLPKTMNRDGYKFGGWFTDERCTRKIASISAKNCGDYEIYAAFRPLTYSITYVANTPKGAKLYGKMPAKKATFGEEVTVDDCGFYISGYTFAGWSYSPEADRIDIPASGVYSGGYQKKVKLYAVWFR